MAKNINRKAIATSVIKYESNCMLIILIVKPMQFTSVNPVPFNSVGDALATKLENCGESAVTAIPHRHQPVKNNVGGN